MEPVNSGKQFRNYTERPLKCPCGCEFFTKVTYNKYKQMATDLFNGQKQMNTEHKAELLQCLSCDRISLPMMSSSYTNGLEVEIASEINALLTAKYRRPTDESAVPKE